MHKLLLIIMLLFSSSALARAVYVNNKAVCESTKGNWRLYNNDCGDSCNSKFDNVYCASNQVFACDCGENKCWDGDKCIANKIGKISWDNKTKEARKKRAAELKELAEKVLAYNQTAQNAPVTPTLNQQTTTPEVPASPPTQTPKTDIPPIAAEPAPVVDPETERMNNIQKELCEKQSGTWQEFKNGCADHCGTKISKIAMCTMVLTMGCNCEGSKCWDARTDSCVELDVFKASLEAAQTKAGEIKPTESLPPMPNININSDKKL